MSSSRNLWLNEKEIEARLDLWDQEQLALIQEYLDQRVSTRAKAEQAAEIKAAPSAQDDAVVASWWKLRAPRSSCR